MKLPYRLVEKTYRVDVANKGHMGDEVYLTGNDDRFRVHTLGDQESMQISFKTLPEFAAYFRKLADRIEALHGDMENHPEKLEMEKGIKGQ